MGKRANPMAVKAALTYDVSEAAKALGKSEATIRNWIKDGLPVMASMKPLLISGVDLRDYLRAKYQNSRATLAPDELYCFACRAGRKPAGLAVSATPNNSKTTRLNGVCGCCGGRAGRLISNTKFQEFAQTFHFKKDGEGNGYEIPLNPA